MNLIYKSPLVINNAVKWQEATAQMEIVYHFFFGGFLRLPCLRVLCVCPLGGSAPI